jgi:hypothetical protein
MVTGSGEYETVTLKMQNARSSETSEQTITTRCEPPLPKKLIW